MSRRRQIYEGKAKILYEGPEPGTLIQYFKDDATAFNAQKKGTINGKGVLSRDQSKQAVNPGPDFGPYGLPKVKVVRIVVKKAKKAKEEEKPAAEGEAAEGAAPTAEKKGAPAAEKKGAPAAEKKGPGGAEKK